MKININQVLETYKNSNEFLKIEGYNNLFGFKKEKKGKKEILNFYFFWEGNISIDDWYKASREMKEWAKQNNIDLSSYCNDFTKPKEVRHLWGRTKTFWNSYNPRRENIEERFYKFGEFFDRE